MPKLAEEQKNNPLFLKVRGELGKYLVETKQNFTYERELLLWAILSEDRPMLASDLHKSLLALGNTVSLTTIYNVLNLFCRAGVAVRLALPRGTAYLAVEHCRNRLIIVCNECGKVVYQHRNKLYQQLVRTIIPHFLRLQHTIQSYGCCSECYKLLYKQKKARRSKNLK